jgi:hypothetical protein
MAIRQVLVVEDETLIAIYVQGLLRDLGVVCIGPIGTLSEAIRQAETALADAAIINLIIEGQPAFAVAEILARRGIPFGFASGAHRSVMPPEWLSRPHVNKPYSVSDIQGLLAKLLDSEGNRTEVADQAAQGQDASNG